MTDTAYTKALEARVADLEDRMDNMVEGVLHLINAVDGISGHVLVHEEKIDLLHKGSKALGDATRILAEEVYGRPGI